MDHRLEVNYVPEVLAQIIEAAAKIRMINVFCQTFPPVDLCCGLCDGHPGEFNCPLDLEELVLQARIEVDITMPWF